MAVGSRYIRVGGVVVEVTHKGENGDSSAPAIDRVFDGFLQGAGDADYRLTLHSSKDAPAIDHLLVPDRRELKRILRALERRFPFTGLPYRHTGIAHGERNGPGLWGASFGRVSLRAIEDGRLTLVPAPSFILAVDHEERAADALLLDDEYGGPQTAAVLAVEALYGVMLPEYGGMILHAAAINVEGRGVLLMGGADTGKTTVSSRVSKEQLLSDDGAVCIRRDGSVSLVPSPFTQTLVDSTRVNTVGLASLMFLFQDEADYTEPMPPGEAMVSLLSNHIHFFRFMSPRNARLTFRMIERIIHDTPIKRLHFSLGFDPTAFFMEKTYVRKKEKI